MRLSVDGVPQLRAAVLALKAADRDLRRDIYDLMRRTMNPVWRDAVESRTRTRLARLTIGKGVRIKAGNPPVLMAATSRRRVSKNGGGLIPDVHWPGLEYGVNSDEYSEYSRRNRRSGGTHTVRRRTTRHLPDRTRRGHILGPAVAEVAPRLASLAVQAIVRTYMDILDKKG